MVVGRKRVESIILTNEILRDAYHHSLTGLSRTHLSKDKKLNVKIKKNVSSSEM